MRARVCLLFTFLLFAAESAAQSAMERKLSLHLSGATVSQLLAELEKQAGVSFMYEDRVIDVTAKVTVNADKRSLYQILRIAFPEEEIAFSCLDNQVIIHRTKAPPKRSIPPNTKLRYLPVYDTVRVTVFDTLVTTLADTSVVLVYDTLYSAVPALAQWLVLPMIDLRSEFYGRNPDSLALLRKDNERPMPGFSVLAAAYRTVGGVQIGVGLMYRQTHTKLSYDIVRDTKYVTADTAYYRNDYYEYFLAGRWQVTGYGDSVYSRYTDSILRSEVVPQIITRSKTLTQRYSSHGTAVAGFIGLPISVRKSFSLSQRSTFYAEATSELSIRLFSLVPAERGELAPDFAMRSVFWYGSLGAAYERKLTNGSSLLFSTRFSVSAQQLYNSATGTNIRTISSIGIGYGFGK